MAQNITEDLIDFVKLGMVGAPPVAQSFFGLPLQDWMYIASIIASLFFILDKLPAVIGRIYAKFKKQSGNSCSSDTPNNPPGG